ncbi:MAG: phage portal protein [Blautia hansenii]
MTFWKVTGDEMSVMQKIKNIVSGERQSVSLEDREVMEWLGITPSSRKAVAEVTYYTCLKMLSETIGKMTLKYYRQTERGRIRAEPTEAAILMTVRPNPFMTPTTMWTTVEQNCQHYGNGYIWVRTQFTPSSYGGEYHFLDMWPMQSNCVTPMMDDIGIFGGVGKLYYQYNDPRTGKQYIFRNSEVLHFKTWYSFDGFMGEPVRTILKATVDGSNESQDYMNRLYKQGLTASMAMQYTGDLEDDKVRKLKRKFADMLSGPKNAGKVVPVPMGLTLTPLNMSLTDAQFFELRKYSALQIAGAFGIKPNQINNYEKSSYANSETQQLAFLVDTMSYRLKNYEEEINGKILLPQEIENQNFYKFNEKAILRTDSKTQMENLAKAVNNGIYTANEAREYMDMPAEKGGDQLMVNGNYIPITQIGQQYKGGEKNGSSQD